MAVFCAHLHFLYSTGYPKVNQLEFPLANHRILRTITLPSGHQARAQPQIIKSTQIKALPCPEEPGSLVAWQRRPELDD